MNDAPERLHPVYKTPELNSEILLYKGPLEFGEDSKPFRVDSGEIFLSWLPTPKVKFRVRGHLTNTLDHPLRSTEERKPMSLVLIDKSANGKCLVNKVNLSLHQNGTQTINAEGEFWETPRKEPEENIAYVIFHLTNFVEYMGESVQKERQDSSAWGRLNLESPDWRVTVDAIEDWEKDVSKSFNNLDGYAITHVCKFEKTNGSPISVSEIADIREKLKWFFTFIKGAYCYNILPVGYDKNGNKVWEDWRVRLPRLTGGPLSWFPSSEPEEINSIFAHFLELMDDDTWKKVFVPAIDWYVGSQNSFHTGANIVSSQVGIELLAWSKLFEIDQAFSKTKFVKLKAAGRMREILNWAGLPLTIPTTLPYLLRDANTNSWADGPHSLVKIRDSVVHPNLRGRMVTVSRNALHEAKELGTWYLELLLLKLLDYQGSYHNRLDNDPNHLAGYSEPVPWMKKTV
jgi:hypothetical protein